MPFHLYFGFVLNTYLSNSWSISDLPNAHSGVNIAEIWQHAYKLLIRTHARTAHRYNLQLSSHNYKLGDLVMLSIIRLVVLLTMSPRSLGLVLGPFWIVEVRGMVNVTLSYVALG